MEPLIFVVRHAEAEHNVIMDFSQRDPPLTLKGFDQASHLAKTFPEPRSISVVLTSPLKRALQTTLKGFSQVIALDSVGEDGQNGAARLLVDRDLQETSDLPCDTGSERNILEELFPNVDLTTLDKDWFVKTSMYAADEEAVILRAKTFRKKLWNIVKSVQSDQSSSSSQKSIVVVTHSAFMQYLSQDMNPNPPQAGWNSFRIKEKPDGEIVLLPT